MDPDQTLDDLKTAIRDERWDDALDHCTDLLRWLCMDGFPPSDLAHPVRGRIDVPSHAPIDLQQAVASLKSMGW